MILGIFTDSIENAFDIFDDLTGGNEIDKRKLAKLLSDGVEIAAIAAATGVAVETLESLVGDMEGESGD